MSAFGGHDNSYNAPGNNGPISGWPDAARQGWRQSILSDHRNFNWAPVAQAAATAYCQSLGYPRAVNVAATDPPISGETRWVYRQGAEGTGANQGTYRYHAALVNSWSATCQKKVRVRRR